MPAVSTLIPVKVEELSLHACRLAVVQVPAAFPSPAGDDLEDIIDPIAWIVRHESSIFWWKVSGNSLVNEGICDGDLIAVDRAGVAKPGCRIRLVYLPSYAPHLNLIERLWHFMKRKVLFNKA